VSDRREDEAIRVRLTMEDLGSGLIYLKAGERCPYICPVCRRTLPYDEEAVELTCVCGYTGTPEDFSEGSLEFHSGVQ
jgi:hypothetical protein